MGTMLFTFLGIIIVLMVIAFVIKWALTPTRQVDDGQADRTLACARQLKYNGAWNKPRVRK